MSSDAKIRGATEAGEGVAADLALEPASFNPSALDDLPSAESLAGDAITVDPRDPDWAPPAITNQWAGLVAGRGVFAYEGLSSPEHYAASEHGRLYVGLNGGPLTDLSAAEAGAAGGGAAEVTYRWYPSRIERSQQWRGVEFKVVTLLPGEKDVARSGTAVVNLLTVSNPGADDMNLDLMFLVSADTAGSWDTNWPPRDLLRASVSRGGDADLLLSDRESSVASAVVLGRPLIGVAGFDTQNGVGAKAFEGVDDPFAPTDHLVIPTEPEEPRWQQALADGQLDGQLAANAKRVALHVQLQVPAGGTADLTWVHAIGADGATASTLARRYLAESAALVATTRDAWEEEWRAAFDADSTRFSGHLPVLVSDQAAVTRIYYMGVLTLLYCRRAPVWGGRASTYITGFPSSLGTFPHTWVFPWDTMMVSGVLSLLDPKVMRELITSFLAADMHKGCAIDFGTGKPQGFWYAVNDYALIHMSWQYLRYTGDVALLAESVRGATVLDHLVDHAHYYRRLAGEDGLADYGTARNLLECVSSYTHKVASFNAANVWSGRTVAAMLRLAGRDEEAAELEITAAGLSDAVLELYVEGEGYFACRQPDGSQVGVRHCLDFFTVLQCMPDALSETQVREMIAFFRRELKTTRWMHALSPLDPDAAFSSRTDHQDEGAYTTWPAYSLEVLLQTGHERLALEWIGVDGGPGLVDVTRQGPFGQAYTHGDDGSPTIAEMPAKAPMEFPHIEKPVLLPGGKYAQVVIEALAGVQPRLGGDVEVEGRELGIAVRLENLNLRGQNWRAAGAEKRVEGRDGAAERPNGA